MCSVCTCYDFNYGISPAITSHSLVYFSQAIRLATIPRSSGNEMRNVPRCARGDRGASGLTY